MNENYPPTPTHLAAAAMLYASGEMEPTEAGAFEARLALDQEAREALAEAVFLLTPMANGRMPKLEASYRQRVRRRWKAQRASRQYGRLRPLFWALTGAAAASVLWFVFLPQGGITPVAAPPVTANKATSEAAPPMEAVFADMSNLDNLARHHQQHVQHKQRQDDFMNHHRANQMRPVPPGGGGAAL